MAQGISSLVFTPEGSDEVFTENQMANHYIFIYEEIKDRLVEFCKIHELRSKLADGVKYIYLNRKIKASFS